MPDYNAKNEGDGAIAQGSNAIALGAGATLILQQAARYQRDTLHMLGSINPSFEGRAEEIGRILGLIRQKEGLRDGAIAITSLTGMGGIGKTELATVLAHALSADYPDAQLVIELGGRSAAPRTPSQELARVLQLIYPQDKLPDDAASLQAIYHHTLHGKKCAVLIDDAASEADARALLPPPGSVALITSRRALAVGERVPLTKLTRADAVAVLRNYRPLGDPAADALAALCADHPLALNVAGAFLKRNQAMPTETYLRELGKDRLGALRAEQHLDPEGQRVEAVFEHSYATLTAAQQSAWLALSVMPASFDLSAGVAVSDAGEDGLTHPLYALAQANLLEYDPQTERYGWHDLLKDFARARLPAPARAAAHLRHVDWVTSVEKFAQWELYLKGQVLPALTLFDRERAHFEAAFAWLSAQTSGGQGDGAAAAIAPRVVKLVDAVTYTSNLRFHPHQRIVWLEAQRDAARAMRDRGQEGAALGNLGLAYADLGEPRRAIEFYEQALKAMQEIGDKRAEGSILGNLGLAYADLGEPRRAIVFYEQDLMIAREIGDRRGEGSVLGNLGLAYADLGEPRRAIEFHEQALKVMQEIGDKRAEGSILGNLGVAYKNLGEPRRAIEFHEQALIIDREIGDRRGEGSDLGNLGLAYAALGEPRRAIEFYEQQLVITREIGDRSGEANASWNLGLRYEALGDLPRAVELMMVLVMFEREIGHPDAEKDAAGVEQVRARMQGSKLRRFFRNFRK